MRDTAVYAEFPTAQDMVRALRCLREAGYQELDAYSPHAVDDAARVLDLPRSPLTWLVLPFALLGGGGAYLIQWLCNAVDYPLDVGGRPPHSAAAFVPITFELTVLCAGLAAVVLLFVLTGLPRLAHPFFRIEGSETAMRDRYWVAVLPSARGVDRAQQTMRELGALRVVSRPGGFA